MDEASALAWGAATLRSATPLLLVLLGETLTQRSGIINLGVEGQMLVGAVTGFAVAATTGDPALALVAGAGAGLILSLVHALLCLGFRANQIGSGIAVWMLGLGISSFYGRPFIGAKVSAFAPIAGLSPMIWGTLALAPLVGMWLYGTRPGLVWRAVGESVENAHALGVRPRAVQLRGILIGGLLSGLGGVVLSVDYTQTWANEITKGRGLVAVGLVIVARWNPFLVVPAALFFGLCEAAVLRLQARGLGISSYLLACLPYAACLAVLVAIGGNATHPDTIRGTTEEQEDLAGRAARALLPLARRVDRLLITHGNGPVVGKILMRMMLTRDHIPPMRLDVCVAHSQGGIGYLLMQALENEFARAGIARDVACVLTPVEVDPADPAFTSPSKPVGPFLSRAEAVALEQQGWSVMEDAARGWRHCVPSPEPRAVLNLSLIRRLLATQAVVIAGGGGGIPVVRDDNGAHRGVAAVIDKDLTSALLARALGIRRLMILTAVDRVSLDFGTPAQRSLGRVTAGDLRAYQQAGHFARGSMGPKIEAALRFVEGGGERAIISHLERATPALAGETGTHVVPG